MSILKAIGDWKKTKAPSKVILSAEFSIDAAQDDRLLQLCAEAGLENVFIGIESPQEDSLKETRKYQNTGIDLIGSIR